VEHQIAFSPTCYDALVHTCLRAQSSVSPQSGVRERNKEREKHLSGTQAVISVQTIRLVTGQGHHRQSGAVMTNIAGGPGSHFNITEFLDRDSVCIAQPRPYVIALPGAEGFKEELTRFYNQHENNALADLAALKAQLRDANPDDFWAHVTKGLAQLTGAQLAFISKRVLHDEHDRAVEMPPIGEPGSCLMASSIYAEDAEGDGKILSDFKYDAHLCPCSAMRHDKVFLIPERFDEHITSNPNILPQPMESFLGVPLFAEGKCFAHFGVLWSKDGSARRQLSWGFLEMLLHGMEDMIVQRLIAAPVENGLAVQQIPGRVVPHKAVTAHQSLKPYARSLSHELRTPMQGVVGVLDVMYATLTEASETQNDPRMRKIFEQLRHDIETIQGT
jgi:hypothetical protein